MASKTTSKQAKSSENQEQEQQTSQSNQQAIVMDQLHGKHRQPIKLCSSLKKLTSLDLTSEKKELMESSVFYKFLQVQNTKESSSTLISGLCKLYDVENGKFVFNNKASMCFCTKEVAHVLGIKDTGTGYKVHIDNSKFPNFMYELKKEFASADSQSFTASDLKKILKSMPVDDEHMKLYFKQLLSYFLVEQMLLCSGNPRILRSSFWGLVKDLNAFDKINWAKAIFDHMCESLKDLKKRMGNPGQHDFKGAAPVLEALVYERISSVRPTKLEERFSDPPIQKYGPQRNDVFQKLCELTPEEIKPCPWCAQGLAIEDGTSSAASFESSTGKAAAPKKATKKAASKKAPTEAAPKEAPTAAPKKAPTKEDTLRTNSEMVEQWVDLVTESHTDAGIHEELEVLVRQPQDAIVLLEENNDSIPTISNSMQELQKGQQRVTHVNQEVFIISDDDEGELDARTKTSEEQIIKLKNEIETLRKAYGCIKEENLELRKAYGCIKEENLGLRLELDNVKREHRLELDNITREHTLYTDRILDRFEKVVLDEDVDIVLATGESNI